ncbi:MAG: TonB-dependent receptor [Gammaproteobacteria bacterium]|nr:TonB-dependent receptor [Gammaproteobacteria bacterium]
MRTATSREARRGNSTATRITEAVQFVLTGALAATSMAHAAAPDPAAAAPLTAPAMVASVGEVLVTARRERQKKQFITPLTTKTLDQDQIRASSLVGGAAQVMNLVPGVSISSYGGTGASKTSVSLNGVKIGWGGLAVGNPDNGSIAVTFDGVPMQNPGNDLWQATLVPQTSLLDTMSVTYGPGEVKDRWYTNIGGSLNFVPLQPRAQFGGDVALSYGTFQTKEVSFELQTGELGGWRTVLAGGYQKANNFLVGYDGYRNPSSNYAYYAKTRHAFGDGSAFSLGAYIARSGAQRPLAIPVAPMDFPTDPTLTNPNAPVTCSGYPCVVTVGGLNANAPVLSQATTGFYTTLPFSVNWKYDTNAIEMLWSHLDVNLTDGLSVHNLAYFDHEHRLHYTPLHNYIPGSVSLWEVNQPSSYVLGDKLTFEASLPWNNHLSAGGYLQVSKYHSQEQLFNPDPAVGFSNPAPGVTVPPGVVGSAYIPNGAYDSDIWNQLNGAIFLQDTFTPIPTLDITAGGREVDYAVDFYHNEDSQWPLAIQYNPGGELSLFPSAHKNWARPEPFVGFNWRALPWLAFYGNYGVTYRYPENGGGTGPYVVLPADQVQLEKGADAIGGIKLRAAEWGPLRDMALDLSYSHLRFSNETLATALPSGGGKLAFASSVYDAVNAFGEVSPLPDLYVFANAGIVSANFTDYRNQGGCLSGCTNVPVPNTPTANMNFGLLYKLSLDGVLIQPRLSYIRTGSQYIFSDLTNVTSNIVLPSYGILNFSASATVPTSWGTVQDLKFTVEVDNLADKKYNTTEYVSAGGLYGGGPAPYSTIGAGAVLAYPGAPRAVYGTVTLDF